MKTLAEYHIFFADHLLNDEFKRSSSVATTLEYDVVYISTSNSHPIQLGNATVTSTEDIVELLVTHNQPNGNEIKMLCCLEDETCFVFGWSSVMGRSNALKCYIATFQPVSSERGSFDLILFSTNDLTSQIRGRLCFRNRRWRLTETNRNCLSSRIANAAGRVSSPRQ